jgi:glycosyltransferase involved in cell wall biosynthesis
MSVDQTDIKKFLLVASYPDSLLNFRKHLLIALMAEGIEVHVVAPNLHSEKAIKQQLQTLGVHVHEVTLKRTGVNPLIDLRTLYELWNLMHRISPDFSLGYTVKPVIYGTFASWLAFVPRRFALITGLGYTFQGEYGERSWLQNVVQRLFRIALGKAHKVFFQNPDDEALFHNLGIINHSDEKTVVVNGSGIDVTNFKVAPIPKKIRFLLIARLMGDKGIREYVKAAGIVKRQHHNISFGLVGWIDENPNAIGEDELQSWIEVGDIQFYGRLEDVKPVIAESSVYVLPSYREGTPRTVLEAMAMGRPIITTDAPGCRETVVDGVNGFLVPVKAVDELALAMLKFIEKPDLIEKMGHQSRQLAEEKYDVHKVNEHMLKEMKVK